VENISLVFLYADKKLAFQIHKHFCIVCKSKDEISHKPLALCRSLLSLIGPFSPTQPEYSAYTYATQNNRATAAVKLENTSNTTP